MARKGKEIKNWISGKVKDHPHKFSNFLKGFHFFFFFFFFHVEDKQGQCGPSQL